MESVVLMTPSQVARRLNVSADTVRVWADSGRLPCIRTSAGHRLFMREDVEQFVQDRAANACGGTPTADERAHPDE